MNIQDLLLIYPFRVLRGRFFRALDSERDRYRATPALRRFSFVFGKAGSWRFGLGAVVYDNNLLHFYPKDITRRILKSDHSMAVMRQGGYLDKLSNDRLWWMAKYMDIE